MAEYTHNDIIKLALDTYHNNVANGKFDAATGSDKLREALIAANGGSTEIDYKSVRRNQVEIFEILEELIPYITKEGLEGDEFFMNLVEERNLALGDKNEFWVDTQGDFIVSKVADGIATFNRQRLGAATKVTIDTCWYGITIYEELSLFLAKRRDWNAFVNKVAKAFKDTFLNAIYTTFAGISASTVGLNGTYVQSGTYNEATLLELVEHVEAATGKTAMIVGTKSALRKCNTAVISPEAKSDYYNIGYYGKLAGVPMISVKNKHAIGTDTFIFPDNVVFVLASDDKPIKYVHEGTGIIRESNGDNHADESLGYTYKEKVGVGLIINGKLGKYTMTTSGT